YVEALEPVALGDVGEAVVSLVLQEAVASVRGKKKIRSPVAVDVAHGEARSHEALKAVASLRARRLPETRLDGVLAKERAWVLRAKLGAKLGVDAVPLALSLRGIGNEAGQGVLPFREANGLVAHFLPAAGFGELGRAFQDEEGVFG